MTDPSPALPRVTVPLLRQMKARGERISVLTAYDATFARLFDEAGIDVLLVGDSLGMVVQGLSSTLPVTQDEMLYHTRAVARGARRSLVVGDMPFLTYQVSPEEALRHAGQFLQNGAHAVKLEGGVAMAPTIRRLVEVGIPVMGHVGLTPQSVHALGGFKVQGRGDAAAEKLLADARALEQAGCFSLVLEAIPPDLAAEVTSSISIPTIGIGAGNACDGQVLVCTDLLGMSRGHNPKFAKRFAELGDAIVDAVRTYVSEVQSGEFPGAEHTYKANRAASVPPPADLPSNVVILRQG
jgi:3-methyl-2-oxobutanoate hydroxymethyltransferase